MPLKTYSCKRLAGTVLLALLIGSPAAMALPSRRTPVVDAVEQALPSVVNIGSEGYMQVQYDNRRSQIRGSLFDRLFNEFFGPPPPPNFKKVTSLGSGVIIHPAGYILTNFHVIERATLIKVTTYSGMTYQAQIIASDEINDLALLRIKPEEELQAIHFEKDEDLLLGETVIAVGNPLGLSGSVTRGVLSAKNREARYEGEVLFRDILQTDAAVNYGSSGGPLINVHGNMIGVSVAIYPEAQNIGFAVPVARVRALLSSWLSTRTTKKAWLGFDIAQQETGLVVQNLDLDSEAYQLGIREGDVLREVNGEPVSSLYDVHYAMLPFEVGDGPTFLFKTASGEREEVLPIVAVPSPPSRKLIDQMLGLSLKDQEASSTALGFRINKGLMIDGVTPDSPGQKAGLVPGLLIVQINDQDVNSMDDVGHVLEKLSPGQRVVVQIVTFRLSGGRILARRGAVEVQLDGT